MYYLQSRYYSSDWGRFINVDGTLKSSGAGILGHNMYLYCANNPINLCDPKGRDAEAARLYLINNPMPPIYAGPGVSNAKLVKWKAGLDAAYAAPGRKSNKTKIKKTSNQVVLASSNNGHGNVPTTGKPNSRVTKPNGDVRVYGPDGRALKDIDSSHPQNHPELENPHEHDWEWDGDKKTRGKPHNYTEEVIEAGVATGVTVGAGYLIYRAIRLIPSIFFPPSLVPNLIVP